MMGRKFRVFLWAVAVMVVAAAVIAMVTLWQDLSAEWSQERVAAQYALNHSPLNQIDYHSVFTGAGLQEVYSGTDVFGKRWYAFVNDQPLSVRYVSANQVVNASRVLSQCQHLSVRPSAVSLGCLDNTAQSTLKTSVAVVWEVTGHEGARPVYLYFDAATGRLIQRFLLT